MKRLFTAICVIYCLFAISLVFNEQENSHEVLAFNSLDTRGGLSDRVSWELNRLVDPQTGRLPANMSYREMKFAERLPRNHSFFRNDVWTNRGPYNVGGRTRAAAVDVSNENVLFAGGVSGGLWRSTDAGKSWSKITPTNQFLSISSIAQDTRTGKTNTWYYGTGEAYGNSASGSGAYFYGNGLYKSVDGGLTWSQLESTISNNTTDFDPWDICWRVKTDASNDTQDVVYAACLRRIYRSEDAGQNWNLELGGSFGSYFTDIAVSSTGVVYATMSSDGNQKGIWRSEDGQNWVNILPADTFPEVFERIVLDIDPNNENVVYFLAHTPGYGKLSKNYRGNEDWNSLWKYRYLRGNGTDSNGVWENLSEHIPSTGTASFDNFNAQGSYNLDVKVKPGDSNVVFIAGTNIYRSTDAFSTSDHVRQIGGYGVGTKRPKWTVYPNHHPDQHEMLFLKSDPDVLINGNDGGMFRTNDMMADTVVWESLNNGYLTTQLYTISIQQDAASDILLAGLQDNGNLFVNSSDPTENWVLPLNGDGSYSAIAKNKDFYILSTQLGKMAKMKLDEDGSRLSFTRIDPIGGENYQFINPFVLDPNDNNKLYLAAGYRLWRNDSIVSLPYAENYDSISSGWFLNSDSVTFPNRSISALAISQTNPAHRLYYGTTKSVLYRVDDAHEGDPEHKRISSLINAGNISCIAVDPHDADKLMVVFSNYKTYSLFYSEDGGDNWSKVAGNLEENDDGTGDGPSVRWADIMHVNGKTLYLVGTSIGLFGTDELDGLNTTWIQLGPNSIGNVVVDMIKTRELDGTIVIATHGNGVYSAKINKVEDVLGTPNERENAVKAVKIFPNPVRDHLQVIISHQGLTYSYAIVDLKGKTLLKGKVSGNTINTADLDGGTYFLVLRNGEKEFVERFIKL
jgi:photosystem II stability/assembly factor-like uncharacterized protein